MSKIDWDALASHGGGALRDLVVALHDLLATDHRHFGYRVANEIARFVNLAAEQAGPTEDALWAALDLAVLQKVLPKFHGTQQELEVILQKLFAFSIKGKAGIPRPRSEWKMDRGSLVPVDPATIADPMVPRLPRTAAKLWRMLRRLEQQGFTSYME